MKVVILYHPNSDHGRAVEAFARDFEHAHPDGKLELLSLETQDGSATASLYDVMSYPAILAMNAAGELLKAWQGELPLMNDLAYYAANY